MAEWVNSFSNKLKRITESLSGAKPLAEALPELLDPGDPRVAIRPLGNDWLCPFTAQRVLTPDWDGSSHTLLQSQAIRNHLLNSPELRKRGSKAAKKPYDELLQITIKWRISNAPNYKFSAPDGEWVCPYCLHKHGILLKNWDGSETDPSFFIPLMLEHFSSCAPYQQDPLHGARGVEEIAEAGGDRAKVAKLVATDARFHLCDTDGSWLCPYSARYVAHLNLKREPWGPELQDKIVDYIMSPDCPGRYAKYDLEITLEDLKTAASANKLTLM
jgi:hypothetical protein